MAKTLYVFFILGAFILRAPTSSLALDVTEFGAIGDGKTDDSQGFLRGWETVCKGTGQGTELVVPARMTFMLQPLIFQGPCISGPINIQIYGDIVAPRKRKKWIGDQDHWITFSDVDGLVLDGDGQIDGRGSSWWKHEDDPRPTALNFKKCNNLRVSGLRHVDSPMAHIHINNCNGVTISDLRITAPELSPNTDGIDIAGSTNVRIQNCVIATGDDCIAINSGSSFISISGVQCGPGHGISIGSLGKDGDTASVEEVYVQDCSFMGTTNGARIKTWQGGSGYARRIVFKGIKLDNVKNPIIIDQYYCIRGSECNNQTSAVEVSKVLYEGFEGTSSSEYGITFRCSETVPCTDIFLSNVNIESAEEGQTSRGMCFNVKGVVSSTMIPLPGLDCLTHGETLPRPQPGQDPGPPWHYQGRGKRLRVHGTFFALLLSWLLFLWYIL